MGRKENWSGGFMVVVVIAKGSLIRDKVVG